MKQIIRKHYLNVLIVVSTILSFIGYYLYFKQIEEQASIFDILYSVLRLFIFENDFEKEHLNVCLNIARFLAPASLATVVIKKILNLFSKTLKKEQAKRSKNHTIFCGNSKNLLPLIKEQAQLKQDRILILPEEDKQFAPTDVLYLQYSEFTPEILDDIAFYHSKYVIISNQNDLHSLEYATSLVQSIDIKRLKKKIDVVVVFNNPEWSEISNDLQLLEELNQQVLENPFINIRYINYLDRGIRKLLQVLPPDKFKPVLNPDDSLPEVLITGFNELSKRLIIGLALNCHYINHTKIKIYIHSQEDPEIDQFIAKYQLQKMIELISIGDIALEDFHKEIDVIYLCNENSTNLYGNIALLNRNPALKISYKIICTTDAISRTHFKHIIDHIFVARDETDTLAALIDESIDKMAQTIHINYLQTQSENKQLSSAMDTHREWEKLTDEAKDRNRYPADHMLSKIRAMNCGMIEASSTEDAFDVKSFEFFEDLSEAEHNRWCAYMYYKGWRTGTKRDNSLKIHPDLIPYEQLDEDSKKKDRENILQIPVLFGIQNLKLIEKKHSPH